jgi:predicted DNA-binding protein with PD1-like motif
VPVRSAELQLGRRFLVVLDSGEEIVAALAAWADENAVAQATVDLFFGAFRSIRLIAAHEPAADPEPPLPAEVEVRYLEGVGSGSISRGADDATRVHLHVAAGAKDEAGLGYAGHVIAAETHYTVEVVVQEVLAPALQSVSDPRAFGLPTLQFGA